MKITLTMLMCFFLGCANAPKESQNILPAKPAMPPPVTNSTIQPLPVLDNRGETLEFKLACINKNSTVDKEDLTVKRFRYLLNNLEAKTQNTRQQIADMSVKSQEILEEEYGKKLSLLEIMEQTNKAIPENSNHSVKYEEMISAVMILLSK